MSQVIVNKNFVWFRENKIGSGLTSNVYRAINLVYFEIKFKIK
jgi:hypothetical protein